MMMMMIMIMMVTMIIIIMQTILTVNLSFSYRNKSVLELGAGTGVAGIACALLGADCVTLTDLDYALANLEINVEENLRLFKTENSPDPNTNPNPNSRVRVTVSLLDWFNPDTYRYPEGIENKFDPHRGNEEMKEVDVDSTEEGLIKYKTVDWDVVIGADIVWLEQLVPG
jgi:predicted nicotinamide N-methyase